MADQKYHAPAAGGVLEILEFMAANAGPWGPTEIGRATGIGTNLAFRILNVLSDHGYAERNSSGKYELGSKLFAVGMKLSARFELRKTANPFLTALSRATGETCQIQIPNDDRMLLLDAVFPERDYYLCVNPGSRLYCHGNAFGKAVLAFLPEKELSKFFEKPLPSLTSTTVVSEKKLRAEFSEIRKTFLAYEFGEYIEGGYCIGSPVFNASGEPVAGLGVTGLKGAGGEPDIKKQSKLVLDCANAVTCAIGGRNPEISSRNGHSCVDDEEKSEIIKTSLLHCRRKTKKEILK